MNKRTIVGIVLVAGLLLAFYFLHHKACKGISCLEFKGKEAFQLKDTYQTTKTAFKGAYTDSGTTLRISLTSVKNEGEASTLIDNEIQKIKAVFANAISPYPGEISNEIVCGEDFVPKFDEKKINGRKVRYLTSYLSQRLTFGACTKEQAVNEEIQAFFYCSQQKNLVSFEIISSIDDFQKNMSQYKEILNSLDCAK